MENEVIAPLVKNQPGTRKPPISAAACCGGAPTTNEDACCQLDEQKKAEGASGCGCNTPSAVAGAGICC